MSNIEVIGAGFGRTGTLSLKTALNLLGFRAYHMDQLVANLGRRDFDMWISLGEGDSTGVSRVLGSYTATTDFPACSYYKELLGLNPNAKVVLTLRDPEKWYQSCCETIFTPHTVFEASWVLQYLPMFRHIQNGLSKTVSEKMFGGDENYKNKKHCIKVYQDHIEEVKRVVPAAQLLLFEVKEGWDPLCKFLNKPVPSVPFPNCNDTADFKKRMGLAIWIDRILAVAVVAAGAALAYYAQKAIF